MVVVLCCTELHTDAYQLSKVETAQTDFILSADELILQDDPGFAPDLDFMPDLEMLNNNLLEETQQFSQSPGGSRSLTNASQQSIGGLMIPISNNSFAGGPDDSLDLFSIRSDSGPGTARVPARLLDNDDLGLDLGMPVASSVPGPIRQPRGPATRTDRTDLVSEGVRMSEQPDQPMVRRSEAQTSPQLGLLHCNSVLMFDSSDKMTASCQPTMTSISPAITVTIPIPFRI